MAAAPASASPYSANLVRLLVVTMLITSGVQAWQIFEPPSGPLGTASPGERVILLNVTLPQEGGAPASSAVAVNANATAPPASGDTAQPSGPKVERVLQAPKYSHGLDFDWEVYASGSPVANTPWTGNGPPTVLVYYSGISDVAMLHNAFLRLQELTGFDVCSNELVRYWNWTALPPSAASHRLIYQSNPVPENPYNLLGAGENCYVRGGVASEWSLMVCMEGDGELSKPREERLSDGRLVRYEDAMDYCASRTIEAGPLGGGSTSVVLAGGVGWNGRLPAGQP